MIAIIIIIILSRNIKNNRCGEKIAYDGSDQVIRYFDEGVIRDFVVFLTFTLTDQSTFSDGPMKDQTPLTY